MLTDKLKSLKEILSIRNKLRSQGKSVVFTNGCFDIIHVWHVRYLQETKKQGDILILGMNSDKSVKLLKGEKRPIVPENERAEIVAAMECVDYIVLFDEKTAERIIADIKPDVYVKGGDYTIDSINQDERRLLESVGAKIVIVKGDKFHSTTNIIESVLKVFGGK